MKSKTVCGTRVLGFLLLALILPATCFKLTKVNSKMLTGKPITADKSDSTIRLTESSTTEVVPSASAHTRTNPSKNMNITTRYTVKTTKAPECDHQKQTGIFLMISFNHFGYQKSNDLMQTTMDIMKEMHGKGTLVRLVIDDLVPRQIAPRRLDKKDWVLKSMIHKLQVDTFFPVRPWGMNVFGFLFVDNTTDFSDPALMGEVRRVGLKGIHLFLVIIGQGVDMAGINKYLVTPEQVINIPSYEALHSSLLAKLAEKICVRKVERKFHIS